MREIVRRRSQLMPMGRPSILPLPRGRCDKGRDTWFVGRWLLNRHQHRLAFSPCLRATYPLPCRSGGEIEGVPPAVMRRFLDRPATIGLQTSGPHSSPPPLRQGRGFGLMADGCQIGINTASLSRLACGPHILSLAAAGES